MSKMIAIMQPTFLPWIGYFAMIAKADRFVFLDSVQFERRSWQSRNKIKFANKEHLLSLACQKANQKTIINEIYLDNQKQWKDKLLKTLQYAYSKSINYEKYFPRIENFILKSSKLADLNIALIEFFCQELEIKTPLFRSSDLKLNLEKKEKGLAQICKYFNDEIYLSAQGSKSYLEEKDAKNLFEDEKINIQYFDFKHPTYTQLGNEFISHLSIVDFLFNEKNPSDKFRQIL